MDGHVRYFERQQFRQRWLWAVLLGTILPALALLGYGAWRQLVRHQPFGNQPMSDRGLGVFTIFMSLVLAGVLLLLWRMRLDIRVTDDTLVLDFIPMRRKRIPLREIVEARARTYDALLEYGGWGIHYGFMNGWAYNVSGRDGVQLVLADGRKLLVGSQRAAELERALTSPRR